MKNTKTRKEDLQARANRVEAIYREAREKAFATESLREQKDAYYDGAEEAQRVLNETPNEFCKDRTELPEELWEAHRKMKRLWDLGDNPNR